VRAVAGCDDGLYVVDIGENGEEDELVEREPGAAVERARPLELVPPWAAGHALDIAALGSTLVLLLERRPPLMLSHDAGATWAERGAGLPAGRAVAIGENADDLLFAARNRLHVSRDGGVFWRAVAVELPEIHDVDWLTA
jgi:hypothetical protein